MSISSDFLYEILNTYEDSHSEQVLKFVIKVATFGIDS